MKLWEAISAFRDDPDTLRKVFGSDKWRAAYFDIFVNFDEFVRKQDRKVLDSLLPLELTREIAAKCGDVFYFYPEHRLLRKTHTEDVDIAKYIEMSALEVHDRFGGSVIEAVFEYGSAYVPPVD